MLARVNVRAHLKTIGPKEQAIEQIVVRLSLEAGVTSIPGDASVDPKDASISTTGDVVHAG